MKATCCVNNVSSPGSEDVSDEAVPDKAVSDEAVPDEAVSDEVVSDEAVPYEAASGEDALCLACSALARVFIGHACLFALDAAVTFQIRFDFGRSKRSRTNSKSPSFSVSRTLKGQPYSFSFALCHIFGFF